MKLLLIPFEDHFNNLINIIKLTVISILIISTNLISVASEPNNLIDYSLDASTKTCTNVDIHLTNEAKQGVLHSPAYYAKSSLSENNLVIKCKWFLNAPVNHQLDLTIIDIGQSTFKNCLTFHEKDTPLTVPTNSTHEPSSMWISLEPNGRTNSSRRLEFNNGQLKSSDFNLRPFTKLETNMSSLLIEYETNDPNNFNFLLIFSASETGKTEYDEANELLCNNFNDELRCQTEFDSINDDSSSLSTMFHSTCLPKNLLCNCQLFASPSNVKCDHLVQATFNDTSSSSSLLNEETNCYYFLKLNNMCQNEKMLSRLINDFSGQESYGQEETQTDEAVLQPNSLIDPADTYYIDSAVPSASDNQVKLLKNENYDSFCTNQTLSLEYGWISSPNFANKRNYASNLNCFYHISFQPNQIVQLRFKHFFLGSNTIELEGATESSKMDKRSSLRSLMPDLDDPVIYFAAPNRPIKKQFSIDNSKKQIPSSLGRTIDYDYLSIYDGPSMDSPIITHLTAGHNDFNRNFNGRVFNSKSNHLLIVFHSAKNNQPAPITNKKLKPDNVITEQQQPLMGFNLTYQIKGLCIEDQMPCNSLYELNCYSKNQTCNDVWDCHNGADERGCGPCKPDQFRCRNHIFCYRLEDRCDGDHQCIDKSDELNCDPWFCNSDNGTFLCNNGRCVYEQWVCDGANDCDDGSDEANCPTPFTRRVITTAVLGGTLCCLLLVMALGCACKLYSLHTVGYRNSIRLTQSVQSAAAAAAASVPLIPQTSSYQTSAPATAAASLPMQVHAYPSPQPALASTAVSLPVVSNAELSNETNNQTTNNTSSGNIIYNNLATLFRRALANSTQTTGSSNTNQTINLNSTNTNSSNSDSTTAATSSGLSVSSTHSGQAGELPAPHFMIAPPTYNQTMGLVDEYEQRQLAFIEHVRSILLAQQQNQQNQQTGLINLNPTNLGASIGQSAIIPTVTSSSTVLHRVTSSSRRSHSSRHHRHHHHNRSASNNAEAILTNQISNNSDNTSSRASHSRRHHHHHHRHRTHAQSTTANNSSSLVSSNNGIANSSNQISNNLSQVNFDSNRRGLVIHQDPSSNTSLSSANSSQLLSSSAGAGAASASAYHQHRRRSCGIPSTGTLGLPLSLNQAINQQSELSIAMRPTTSSNSTGQTSHLNSSEATNQVNQSATFNSMINKSQSNSINLRDRIAKLIKDIVVHHGDNIQYVQLADQMNNSNTNSLSNNNNTNSSSNSSVSSSATNETMATPVSIPSSTTSTPTTAATATTLTTTQLSSPTASSNVSQSEDDVPLIQP